MAILMTHVVFRTSLPTKLSVGLVMVVNLSLYDERFSNYLPLIPNNLKGEINMRLLYLSVGVSKGFDVLGSLKSQFPILSFLPNDVIVFHDFEAIKFSLLVALVIIINKLTGKKPKPVRPRPKSISQPVEQVRDDDTALVTSSTKTPSKSSSVKQPNIVSPPTPKAPVSSKGGAFEESTLQKAKREAMEAQQQNIENTIMKNKNGTTKK